MKRQDAHVLLVDIGNTRIKWAVLRGERLGRQRALEHEGLTQEDVQRQVLRGARGVSRILVCSVGGRRLERLFNAAAKQVCGLKPEYVASARTAAGVTTRYVEPWRLGVDRFVAVIAAHQIARSRGACVIDVGTAMTVDLVDGSGVHQGGAILPGPQLMMATLLKQTAGISRRMRGAAGGAGQLFARSTGDAVEQGARFAAAAVIDRSVAEAQRLLRRAPLLLLTGGAVEQFTPLVQGSWVSVPDLVLRGTALWAGLPVK